MTKAHLALILVAVGLIVFGVVGSVHSLVTWEDYRAKYNCVETGAIREELGPFMCLDYGTGVTICQHQYTTTRREWHCDGGERLWR